MATFEKIATVDVGAGGQSTIEFTAIPSTFTDLCLKVSIRDSFSAAFLDHWIRFNNNTSNYTWRKLQGNGASASSSNSTVDPYMVLGVGNGATSTTSTFSNFEVYIPNYAGSANKSISVDSVGENNATTAFTILSAGLWANTSAITSIQLLPQTSFVQYSTATLYGIKKA